jgi:hypothetical protein
MDKRVELHKKLVEALGSNYVYFQPPESVKLVYPAIVYDLSNVRKVRTNNGVYLFHDCYTVIHIYDDVEMNMTHQMMETFQYCGFDRQYISDGLYHDVYTIYV